MPTPPLFFIPRRATALDGEHRGETRPLDQWGALDAYVLLAEPGAGKTKAFKNEEDLNPAGAKFLRANTFANLGIGSTDQGKILKIMKLCHKIENVVTQSRRFLG